TATCCKTDIATDKGDNPTECYCFDKAYADLFKFECIVKAVVINPVRYEDLGVKVADHCSAGNPDQIRVDYESRHADQAGNEARHCEIPDRVDIESFQGINLFIYLHDTYFCSHCRTCSAGNEEAGHDRTELSYHGMADNCSDNVLPTVFVQFNSGLESENHPYEKSHYRSDWKCFIADDQHLGSYTVEVSRCFAKKIQCLPQENHHLSDSCQE